MKKNIVWTIIIIVIGGIILFLSVNKSQTPVINNTNQNQPMATSTTNTINTPRSFNINAVAQHNNQTSCWTIVDGKIYDITAFISSHPAGVDKIMKGCGIDSTSIFNRVGAHSISRLSNSFVGLLK